MPKDVEDLGKVIGAKGFKKMPKVQKNTQYGHTGSGSKMFYGIGLRRLYS